VSTAHTDISLYQCGNMRR